MQENNSVSTPVVAPPVVPEQPKQSNFLVIFLSVLLFISVSIAGFFAYQTQKLVKELTALKSEEKVVAVATIEPTTEPIATNSFEIDTIVNWKTYTTKKLSQVSFPSVTLSYPSGWLIDENNNGSDSMDLKITKGGYKVSLYQAPMGGGICLFDDSPEFEGPSSDYRSLKYTEINAKSGVLRYFVSPSKLQTYQFCVKSDKYFSSFGLGILEIDIPTQKNEKVFEESVEIVKTISAVN